MGLLALVLVAATQSRSGEPTVSEAGLSFVLPDLEGESHSLQDSSFTGRVVYLTAWGTWCPPCLSEIPFLKKLEEEYGPRGLRVVAIAFERFAEAGERREKLRSFCAEQEIHYLVLDGGSTKDFAEALPEVDGAKGLPIEFLIDAEGETVLVRNSYGFSEEWARDLEERIEKLIGPPLESTP